MGKLNEMAQGAKKGVVNFMLAGDYKEGALAHIDEQHRKAIQKADEKAAKKKEKIEARQAKKATRIPLKERVSNFFTYEEDVEIVIDDDHVIFYGENDEQFNAVIIDAKNLLNEKKEAFNTEALRGQSLLKRNLKTSPLFIEDEGNIVRVNSIQEVTPDEEDGDKAYVLLETKYDYFVLEFSVNRSF